MNNSGGHRVRTIARWIATPALVVALAVVAYANYTGGVTMLRIAGLVALTVGIAGVVAFDTELIRSRRLHGAERSALAKSYAETYAAHIRVTSVRPDMEVSADVRAAAPESAPQRTEVSDTPAISDTPNPDMWDMQDAPTVVDLMAWDVRDRADEADAGTHAEPVDQRKVESA